MRCYLTLTYYSEIGLIGVDVERHNMQFENGYCYFTSNGKLYEIDINDIYEIESTVQIGDDEFTTDF